MTGVGLVYKQWLGEENERHVYWNGGKKYFSIFHPRRNLIPCYFMYPLGLKQS